ncbi:MAG: hypothetical protein U5N58_00365 [Actinomycetota bacterium]|nr:hypothetical protein [Actinomycetota bacterium]
MGGDQVHKGINYLRDHGIPNYDIPETAVETLKVMIDYSEWEKKKAFKIKEFKVDTKSVKELFETNKQIGRLELGEMEARIV